MPAHRTKENQGIVATESRHTVEGVARGREKKEKAPQEKSPQQKKRNRCLRLRLLTGGCAALLSRFFSLFLRRLRRLSLPRASLSSCGRLRRPSSLLLLSRFFRAAAPPYPFRFSSLLRRLRRLSPTRSRGRLAPPPSPSSLSSLSNNYQTFNAVTSHKLFFF